MKRKPICHVVAGPNGSGKSTFALTYLGEYAGSFEYVNPDLMAQGMSPTDIELAAIKAGKLTLRRISELIACQRLEADRRQALEDDLRWIRGEI